MDASQPGILAPVPLACRYLEFAMAPQADPALILETLESLPVDAGCVVGIGPATVARCAGNITALRSFPSLGGQGCDVPSTQSDLWLWIRDDDHGNVHNRARDLVRQLDGQFDLLSVTNGFRHGEGRDLTGYEDGTENPEGDAAVATAFVVDDEHPLNGSSFVAVQMWQHDLDFFNALAQTERDHIIGRRLSDNEEIDDAPASAHVKRTEQEAFEPPAFVLRRSMPWTDAHGGGLMFVAFGCSFDAFEVQLRKMAGYEDGVVDALFRFSRPLSGSYFWCPPVIGETLNLTAIKS